MAAALGRRAVYAAVFAVALWLGLLLSPSGIPFHIDTVRDLLLARGCSGADACLSLGPRSSGFFYHGFLWHRFLALFLGSRLPLEALPAALAVLHALSVVLLFRAAELCAGRLTALVLTALYCLAGFDRSLFNPLWTPTSIPILANAFAWAAGLALLSGGRRRAAAAAAAAVILSLGTQVHNEFLLFLPGLVVFFFWEQKPARARPAAFSAGLLACLTLSWAAGSRDSLIANWRLLASLSIFRAHPGSHQATLTEGLRYASFAAAWAGAAALSRPWKPERGFERFLLCVSGSYLLAFLPVLFTHDSGLRYYAPVIPLLGLLWARAASPVVARFTRTSVLLLGLLALLGADRAQALRSAPGPGLGDPLRLSEIRALAQAFAAWGYDASGMYRQSSGGQRAYLDFISGLWLHAPCLSDQAVLGRGAPRRERVALLAVESGRPYPRGAGGPDWRRVAGAGRDFLLFRFEPSLRLEEFQELRDGTAGPARSFGVENRGFGRRCWDPETLSFGVRGMVSRDTASLRFRLSVPRGLPERTLFLPALDAYGWPRPGCAARFTEVSGVAARIDAGGRRLRFRGTKTAQRGSVTVSWPVHEQECFPDPCVRYPMPILELPSPIFEQLGGVLERR